MAVSQSELKLLLSAQDRASAVVQQFGRAITTAQNQIEGLAKAGGFQRVQQQAQTLGRSLQQAAQQATTSARQIGQAFSQMSSGGGANSGGNMLSNLRSQFQSAQKEAQSFAQSVSQSLRSASEAAKGLSGGVGGGITAFVNGIKTLGAGGAGGIASIAQQFGLLGRSVQTLGPAGQSVNTFGASLRNLIGIGAGLLGIQTILGGITDGMRAFGSAAVGFNADLELARTTFTSLLGSADKARAFVYQLQETAAKTSFDFPGLLKMAQGLVGVGVNAEMVIPLLKDVAGAMTAAGRSSADVVGVGRALQQIVTTGRVQADEMNQLAERGIFGWRILGAAIQQTGETIEQAATRARKFGEAGQISANDFLNAFQRAAKSNDWRQIAENATQTFTGALSNVGDGLRNFISSAMEPVFNTLSSGMQLLATALTSLPVQQFGDNIKATLNELLAPLMALQAAIAQTFNPSALNLENFVAAVGKLPTLMQDTIRASLAGGSNPIQAVLDGIRAQFESFAGEMTSAGAQLIASYAQGIIQGANDVITGAVNFVADLIASFLIGNSPPPAGPLAAIETGGANVMAAYVNGMRTGAGEINSVAQVIVDAFGNIGRSITQADARTAFQGAAGNLASLKQNAADVEGVLRGLGNSIRDLNEQQALIQFDIAGVKDAYGTQITDLERSVELIKDQNTEAEKQADLIQRQNDAITRQADLRDRMALNELKAAQIAAEGDPVKRAALVADQAKLKAREEDLQLAQREHDLAQRQAALDKQRADGKSKSSTTDARDLDLAQQRINLDREQLANARAMNALTNKDALAQIEAQRSIIEYNQALRRVEEDRKRAGTEQVKNAAEIERAQKALDALPLERQIEQLQREQQAILDPLERQLNTLQQQERVLQLQQQRWQAIKANIGDAIQAQQAADKASKGKNAGGPTAFGQQAGFGTEFEGDKQAIDISVIGQRAGQSMLAGMQKYLSDNAASMIVGTLGAVLGAAAFGPLGLVAGAAFGAQLGAAIQQRVPQVGTIIADAGRTFLQAFAGEWDGKGDEWISPLVRAAGMLGIAMKATAETIAAVWNALKGPVGAAMQTMRENMGLVAAALTGLLLPAFQSIAGIALRAFTPIISILSRLSPAMLAVSAAAVALKAAWDNNFGGLQQTVTAAIGPITAALGQLSTALVQLAGGDFSGAFESLLAALSNMQAAIGPIVAGLAEAFIAWLPGALAALQEGAAQIVAWIVAQAPSWLAALASWTEAFIAWIAPMIPPAMAALGQLIVSIVSWITSEGPGILSTLAVWAQAFVAWVATATAPLVAALGEVAQALFAWITTNGPTILATLAAWTTAFIQWVTAAIAALVAALPGILNAVVAWITTNGPTILATLAAWTLAFVQWAVATIGPLLIELAKLADAILTWIGAQIPILTEAIIKWGIVFLAWVLTEVVPKVPEYFDQLVDAIAAWILVVVPRLLTFGGQMAKAIADGIIEGFKIAGPMIGEALTSLWQTVVGKLQDLGRSIAGAVGIDMGINVGGTYQQAASAAAKKYGLNEALFLAQLQQESGFDPSKVSARGAKGIAQFMPATGDAMAAKMGIPSAKFWADTNIQIEAAAMHMKELYDQFKNWDMALAAYNAGPGAVMQYGGIPPYGETQEYVRAVNAGAARLNIPAMGMPGSTGPNARGIQNFRQTQQQWSQQAADANAICGPYLAALFADAVGRPPTPDEARKIGRDMGIYYGAGITSAGDYGNYATAVVRASNPGFTGSVTQTAATGTRAGALAADLLGRGAPLVGFNTPNHYFGATGYNADTGQFNVGGTGLAYAGGKELMTIAEIEKLGGAITAVISLTGQMGVGFQNAAAGATESIQGVEQPVVATSEATKTLAQSLLGEVVPAGTATGTAIQQMSMSINPLLGQIATGSLSTEELTGKLLEMGQQFGLTNVPLEAFQQGQISAGEAMNQLIASAALVDPAFAQIQTQLAATDASAQTMAVTFAEGIGNATGQTAPALEQMSAAMGPLLEQFTSGQITTDQMSTALVEMSAATGATQRPFRMLQDGATTANQALAQVIANAASVSPEFATLSEEVNASGEVTAETAARFAELIANFKPAVAQADAVATATETTTTAMTDAVPATEGLGTALVNTAETGTTAMQTLQGNVTSSLQTTLGSIQDMAGPARDAGESVGKAIMEGIIAGIDSMMGDLDDKLSELKDKLKEIEDAAKKAKDGAKKGGDDKGDDKGGDEDKGGDADTDRAISAAENLSRSTIAAMRRAADAHSPSRESRRLGWDMVEGLEVGQLEDSKYAGMAGDQVVVETLKSMRKAADAHSPSNESKALGKDLIAGLSVGQQEDMAIAADAGSMAVDETLKAMRVTADAHSPSNETYRLGKDIIDGLRKALGDANTSAMAKELISSFLKEFDSFAGDVYEKVRNQILVVQSLIAEQENKLLPLQQKIEEQQQKITEASEGTYRSQLQQNELKQQQLEAEGQLLAIGFARYKTDNDLRDTLAQQEAIRKGTLEVQVQEAEQAKEMASLTAAIATKEVDLLKSKREARDLAQFIELNEQAIVPMKRQQRDLQLDINKQEEALIPWKRKARDAQADIEDVMRGTLTQQQDALKMETETAKGKLRTLQIEDDLANASERGLSQDQVNALFDERSGISKTAENADRQAQMAQLQRQIDTAPQRNELLVANEVVRQNERAIQPGKDLSEDIGNSIADVDRTINPFRDQLEDKNFDIKRQEIDTIQPLEDELEIRQANLDAAQKQRDFMASTLNVAVVGLQQQSALYDAMAQQQEDRITLINLAQQQEQNYRDTLVNGLEYGLIGMNKQYKAESARLVQLQKELALLEAGQKVSESHLAIMNDLRQQLENMGFVFETPAAPAAAPAPEPKDDPNEGTGRGGKKKEKKKDKKKKKSSGDDFEDMGFAVSGVDDGAAPFQDIAGAAGKATIAIGRVNAAIGKQTTLSADLAARAVGNVSGALTDVEKSDPTVQIDDRYVDSTYTSVGGVLDILGTTFTPTYGVTTDQTQLDATYSLAGNTNTRLDGLMTGRTLTLDRTALDTAYQNALLTNQQLDSMPTLRTLLLNDASVDEAVTSTGGALTNLTKLKDGPVGDGVWNATFGVDTTHAFNVGSIATSGATTLTGATLQGVGAISSSGNIVGGSINATGGTLFAGNIQMTGNITTESGKIQTDRGDIKTERGDIRGNSVGRALGGPVDSARIYTVGENGRELFVPDVDGTIIDHSQTERMLRDVDALAGRYDTIVRHRQAGGSLWAGRTYMGGEAGREMVIQPLRSDSIRAPQTTVYQTNQYNLTIHTAAATEPIIDDFRMMQAMNGD